MDLGHAYGLGEAETTAQLLLPVFFNGVAGIRANLVSSFARLDTISAEDREELREEALAALKKHGGLTRESLEEMPKMESFVLEVLRACPSPMFWSTIATRPTTVEYTTESGEHALKVDQGRFLGPDGDARRKHHVIFHGRLTDTPAVNNHMCPGKDVSLSALKGSIAIFNTFFGWELQEPPVWTGTKMTRGSQPDYEVKIKSFWVQHPEDLNEIFPSHFRDIIDKEPNEQDRRRRVQQQIKELRKFEMYKSHLFKVGSEVPIILLINDEYGTSKGGISTINCQVGQTIGATNAVVYATALRVPKQDQEAANRDGVQLIKPRQAIRRRETYYEQADLITITHVLPEDTDYFRGSLRAIKASEKEKDMLDIVDNAKAAFSVGPRIYKHFKTKYKGKKKPRGSKGHQHGRKRSGLALCD
uniref:Uncharacterized protein n=1 Tax=Branchiostoma floridae TaxID=7739 RepID=C3YRY8_BRAFL|eukprot:XP_002600881.1 hypothetical protein BRAFLDRAFT_75835 [Branchiostoma floridae]